MHRFATAFVLIWLIGGCSSEKPAPDTTTVDTHTSDSGSDTDGSSPEVVPEDTGPDTPDVIPECVQDADCEETLGRAACQVTRCVEGACVVEDGPLCCESAADCDPSRFPETEDGCLEVVCEESICQLSATSSDCCTTDTECEDQVANCCESATCEAYTCVVAPKEDCCEASDACDDGDDTTTDVCVNSCVAGGCYHHTPICPDAETLAKGDFDNNTLQGFVVVDSDEDDTTTWHLTTSERVTPSYSIHLGHSLCGIYYNGPVENCVPTDTEADASTPMTVNLESASVTLPADTPAFLGFWIKMSLKPATPVPSDKLEVRIGDEVVWSSIEAFGDAHSTAGEWVYQAVDLSKVASPFKVVFAFTSEAGDNYLSDDGVVLEGVYLDEISIQTSCEAAACSPGDACTMDANGCTVDSCTPYAGGEGGICAYAHLPQQAQWTSCTPCGQPSDCGTNDCYDYSCGDGFCEIELDCCANYTLFPEGTVPPATTLEGFEEGALEGWTIVDPHADNVTWQIVGTNAFEGSAALYFGDPETGTYDAKNPLGDAQPAVATLWSKYFQINKEQYRSAMLTFWLRMSTEYDDKAAPTEKDAPDTLRVLVQKETSGEIIEMWSSATAVGNSTKGEYAQIIVDLSPFEKQTIRFAFAFDSGEQDGVGKDNAHGGVWIDNLALHMVCGTSLCTGAAECDDDDPCTFDSCEFGECSNLKDPTCCNVTADCEDDNSCTKDSCVNGTCVFTFDASKKGCCAQEPWPGVEGASFDTDLGGFTVEADVPSVTWYVDDTHFFAGGGSAHFAKPGIGKYHVNGEAPSGRLISPPMVVPDEPEKVYYMEFMLYMDTEWTTNKSFSPLFAYLDQLSVQVMVAGAIVEEPIWISHFTKNSTFGEWILTRADLTPYAGEEVQLIIEFSAGDPSNNVFPGAFIDELSFGTACVAPEDIECVNGGDCPKGSLCELPTCTENFTCTQTLKNTPECCEPTVIPDLTQTFDLKGATSDAGWKFKSCELNSGDLDPDAEWQVAKKPDGVAIPLNEGTGFLYFGNGTDYGGSNDAGSCGIATSPELTLTGDVPWELQFWVYVDVEPPNTCDGGAGFWVDKLEIILVDVESGDETAIWSKKDLDCDEYDTWVQQKLDLEDYAGKTIQLRFEFNSWDKAKNDGKGIGFDTLAFEKGCAPVE